jgi:hypothetical protein
MAWTELLPERFEFFHLGTVSAAPEPAREAETAEFVDARGAAFRVSDAETEVELAWVVLAFDEGLDEGLDEDTYVEMGNVIASRFAGALARARGLARGASLSPPLPLDAERLARLLRAYAPHLPRGPEARLYHHRRHDRVIPVRAYVLPAAPQGAIAHA